MTDAALTDLVARARAALPPGTAFALADPRAADHDLWPEEAAAMTRAVPLRRCEFAAGRRAARAALAEMGQPHCALPMKADRSPAWPDHVTGSISHTDDACLAVLLPADRAIGIGVDLEQDAPLDPALWPEICTAAERADWPLPEPLAARRIFSAKEAAFKAQYPRSQTLLDFGDLVIQPAKDHGFTARLARPVPAFAAGTLIRGWQWAAGGHILSLALIPPQG